MDGEVSNPVMHNAVLMIDGHLIVNMALEKVADRLFIVLCVPSVLAILWFL